MNILPEFNTFNDIVSIIFGIVAIVIVRQRVFNEYFVETNPPLIKRFSISFLCGIAVGFIICFAGVFIEIILLVEQSSLWNIYSSFVGIIAALSGSDLKFIKSISIVSKKGK